MKTHLVLVTLFIILLPFLSRAQQVVSSQVGLDLGFSSNPAKLVPTDAVSGSFLQLSPRVDYTIPLAEQTFLFSSASVVYKDFSKEALSESLSQTAAELGFGLSTFLNSRNELGLDVGGMLVDGRQLGLDEFGIKEAYNIVSIVGYYRLNLSSLTSIEVSGGRSVKDAQADSLDELRNFFRDDFRQNYVSAQWQQGLSERLSLNVKAQFNATEFENKRARYSDGVSDVFNNRLPLSETEALGGKLGLTYKQGQSLELTAGLGIDRNEDLIFGGESFDANSIELGLKSKIFGVLGFDVEYARSNSSYDSFLTTALVIPQAAGLNQRSSLAAQGDLREDVLQSAKVKVSSPLPIGGVSANLAFAVEDLSSNYKAAEYTDETVTLGFVGQF